MSTHIPRSSWLENADDAVFVKKGGSVLGRLITGGSVGERIEKMLNAPIACRKGCSMTVKDAPSDSMRCAKHGEPLGLVGKLRDWTPEERKAYLIAEAEAEQEQQQVDPSLNRMKRRDGEVLSGGRLDGENLYTDPNRGRSPNVR